MDEEPVGIVVDMMFSKADLEIRADAYCEARQISRSVPQMPTSIVRTRTSFGAVIFGSGCATTRSSFIEGMTPTPFMVIVLMVLGKMTLGADSHRPERARTIPLPRHVRTNFFTEAASEKAGNTKVQRRKDSCAPAQ